MFRRERINAALVDPSIGFAVGSEPRINSFAVAMRTDANNGKHMIPDYCYL